MNGKNIGRFLYYGNLLSAVVNTLVFVAFHHWDNAVVAILNGVAATLLERDLRSMK